jgi:hypothetical protein
LPLRPGRIQAAALVHGPCDLAHPRLIQAVAGRANTRLAATSRSSTPQAPGRRRVASRAHSSRRVVASFSLPIRHAGVDPISVSEHTVRMVDGEGLATMLPRERPRTWAERQPSAFSTVTASSAMSSS